MKKYNKCAGFNEKKKHMKTMNKQPYIFFILFFFTIVASAQGRIGIDTIEINENGLVRVLVEKVSVPSSIATNAVAYRFFVEMENGYKFLAVGGQAYLGHPLYIESTTSFLNETILGTALGTSANPALFGAFPTLEYDSYVADGRMGTSQVYTLAGLVTTDATSTPQAAVSTPDPIDILLDNTIAIEDSYDGWVVNGGVRGPASAPNQVFIAQLTVVNDGELSAILGMISLINPSIDRVDIYDIHYPPLAVPEVTIISPLSGDVFDAGDAITVQATASDIDGSIDSVAFFVNDVRIGCDETSPYAIVWTGVPGSVILTARAYDNDGQSGISGGIAIDVENASPEVTITAPEEGDIFDVADIVTIEATATDNDGTVEQVSFYVDGDLIGTDLSSPYSYDWTAEYGEAEITAVAVDDYGAETTSEIVTIEVQGDNTPPVIYFYNVEEGDEFHEGTVTTITVAAKDDDEVVSVDFFLDDVKIGTDGTPESDSLFSTEWTPGSAGTYSLKALATDSDDATDEVIISITIIENEAPTISLVLPADGSEYIEGDNVNIRAEAGDTDGTVDSVEIFINDIKIKSFTGSGPYIYNWSSESGTIEIKAVATDNSGASSTSDIVTIVVAEAAIPPTVEIISPANDAVFNSGDMITVQVTADDDNAVDSVEFYVNDVKIDRDTKEPFETQWTPATEGTFKIKAIATDDDQASNADSVNITVIDNDIPAITITSPSDGEIIETGVVVNVQASVVNTIGTIDSVEFFINNSKTSTVLNSPYSFNWLITEGSFELKAVATDSYGATDTSDVVQFTVQTNAAPTVTIISPGHNDVLRHNTTILIQANASDADGSVEVVTFYANGGYIGEVFSEPYEVEWLASVLDSNITIIASAEDNDGKTKNAVITVHITEEGPVSMIQSPISNTQIHLFPNPVDDICYINLETAGIETGSYAVFNVLGKEILMNKFSAGEQVNIPVNMQSLTPGLYFIVVSVDDVQNTFRIVKK